MKRFVTGQSRGQATLFPECLDDFIDEDNPVRVIDAFIEQLDLRELGFSAVDPKATGRPAYHPAALLKLYVYGYLNRVQSSRRLERECQRNVELMWLTERLAPDFKTIADFRKDNGRAIQRVCRQFVELCRRLKLFSQAVVAIDGSKFKAVNADDKSFTPVRIRSRIAQLEKHVARYLSELDRTDREEPGVTEARSARLQEKLARLQAEIDRIQGLEQRVLATADQQLSLTDPDARIMMSRRGNLVGYNVQAAVEPAHHLIVAHEVTNAPSDRAQLTKMATQAREVMPYEALTAVADRGYYSGEELLASEEAGIAALVPKSHTSNNEAKGLFPREAFRYDPTSNTYCCPAGEQLIWRYRNIEKGKTLDAYWSSACPSCAMHAKCTTGTYRRIRRWEHEAVLEAAQRRLERYPKAMHLRRQTVEHPFGTIKAWMGHTHFLTRTLARVSTEMSLHVLAYNLKRTLNILGPQKLLVAFRA
jgi:transposase